jgi:hypothetical protein
MKDFLISEMFRLEIRWEDALYNRDGVCFFKNAYFTGPVLKQALKVKDNDHILLDFYSQYLMLVKGVYVGKFSWKEVKYKDDDNKILLSEASLSHESELNRVPKLNKDDFFVVDTSDHTTELHNMFLVYKTYVINNTNDLYRFKKC